MVRQGASTSDNNRFLRCWFEANFNKIGFDLIDISQTTDKTYKWFPYNKGGDYRKWYGNQEVVINYYDDGKELKEFQSTLSQGWTVRLKSREYYFKKSISWSKITSSTFSARFYQSGFIFDVAGCCYYPYSELSFSQRLALLNSKVAISILKFLSPTLNFEIEHIKKIPSIDVDNIISSKIVDS